MFRTRGASHIQTKAHDSCIHSYANILSCLVHLQLHIHTYIHTKVSGWRVMGNCCSDGPGGQSAVGGTSAAHRNQTGGPNDAVDCFLKSRGYRGLFSQIEVFSLLLYLHVLMFVSTQLSCEYICHQVQHMCC